MNVGADVSLTLAERGKRYGEFKDHAQISQQLKLVLLKSPAAKNGCLNYDQQEALEMILHKVARVLNGDPNYVDNWLDIEGYARLVRQRLEKEELDKAQQQR